MIPVKQERRGRTARTSLRFEALEPRYALDSTVVFNELMYDPAADERLEWIELFNQLSVSIDLSGWRLSGGVDFQFGDGATLGGGQYLVIAASPADLQAATGFAGARGPFTGQLSDGGELIELRDRNDRVMDSIDYGDSGAWSVAADGSGSSLAKIEPLLATGSPGNWTFSRSLGGSPGADNRQDGFVQSTPIELDSVWKYHDLGLDLGTSWRTLGFNDAGWKTGASLFFDENDPVPGPKNTALNPGSNTYYFRKTFEFNGNAADVTELTIDAIIDDGAVFYLNGAEVKRLNMPDGAATFSTKALSEVDDAVASGPVTIPAANLVNGLNVLAVEIHQADPGTTNTLAYYRFEEPSGTAIIDAVDGVSHGQLVGAVRTTDVPSPAVPQSGAANSRSVNFTNSRALITGQPFLFHDPSVGGAVGSATLEWYMKMPVADDHSAIFWSNTGTSDTNRFNLFWNAGFTGVIGSDRSISGDFQTPASGHVSIGNHQNGNAVSLNQWHHFAIVRIDNTLANTSDANFTWNWYIDGQLSPAHTQTTTASLPASNNGWLIAGRQDASSGGVDALIDELRLSQGALSPSKFLNADGAISADNDDAVFAAELKVVYQAAASPVALNEISAGGPGFQVELVNYGDTAVNLAGYVLRRANGAGTSDFMLPADSLAPGQYAAFSHSQMGFTPQAGDKLFLYSANGETVLDGMTVDGSLRGRLTPGAGQWYFPVQSTFGGFNAFQLHSEIVINEIMYHHQVIGSTTPGTVQESPEEWIELYNRGSSTVDLSGWRFLEAVDYEFPAGTLLASGEYLVVANNEDLLRSAHPGVAIIGNFDRSLADRGDHVLLVDANGNPADDVRYFDEKPWPKYADGGGSSLELRDPDADNARPTAWAASDESAAAPWQTYAYRGIAGASDTGSPQYHEFILGLLDQGEVLLDDISVIEDPSGVRRQLIQNGLFTGGNTAAWRIIGNHHGAVIAEPSNPTNMVLHLKATGRTDDMHNHAETTLKSGSTFVSINPGREYEISYRAKWLGGSNLLNTRLFFSRVQETMRLDVPQTSGTPGRTNSTREANVGPTFSQFQHGPIVPAPGQPVTVSAAVNEPDGLASIQLRWRVDGGSWNAVSMRQGSDGRYAGVIPGQSAGTKIQFFVRASDTLGSSSDYPAEGEGSRAMYVVNDGQARLGTLHNLRIVMSSSDLALFDAGTNLMSNDLLGATVIVNESEAFYDVGVRRSGAASSRQGTHGFRLEFLVDHLYRGVHETLTVDRNHNEEIFVRHLINSAGGIPGMYNDLVYFVGPTSNRTGFAELRMAGFEDTYLESQFADGGDGTVFEKELNYRQQLSNPSNVESLKVPFGYTHPVELNTDVANLGSDPESYRWNWLIKNHRDIDDYRGIVALNQALSLSGAALDSATRAVMDVDQWLRALAAMRLTGNRDFYSQPKATGAGDSWRHNFWVYERPSDGRFVFLPWDIDENFQVASNDAAIFGHENIAKVIQLPDNLHYYWGHLDDLINETFNATYMAPWANHFSSLLAGQNVASGLNYIESRANYIRSRMPASESFRLDAGVTLQTTLVAAGAAAKALIPTDGDLGAVWTGGNEAAFGALGGDASWLSGSSGVGFQRMGSDNNFGGLYGVDASAMDGSNDSVYVRIPFQISSQQLLDSLTSLRLRMQFDDGFVAYLNGVKVAEANAPSAPQWNSGATASQTDAAAVAPVEFDISQFKNNLVLGHNILAIHGLNRAGQNSSDLLILPELVATRSIPTPSVVNGSFLEVSGRGWINVREIRLAGHSNALPVTWSSPTTWTVRAPLRPGLNTLVFEAYDFQGKLITTPFPNSLTVTSTVSQRPYQDFLRITEIMYHPAGPSASELAAGFTDADEFEFLEFSNFSETLTLDLTGVRITNGSSSEFVFAGSAVTTLGPGEYVLAVRNKAAFELRYGASLSNRIAGEYLGKFDNAGELVVVVDPSGVDIHRFSYDDNSPWPTAADGAGNSLILTSPGINLDPASASSWKASHAIAGSPGAADLASGAVVGDYTQNGVVDAADFALWRSRFGMTVSYGSTVGDGDGDLDVDGADFLAWQRNLGRHLGTAELATTSNPDTTGGMMPPSEPRLLAVDNLAVKLSQLMRAAGNPIAFHSKGDLAILDTAFETTLTPTPSQSRREPAWRPPTRPAIMLDTAVKIEEPTSRRDGLTPELGDSIEELSYGLERAVL